MSHKQVIGGPLEINGRVLSLSRAIRAGDFVFVTGQVPMRDGQPMTDGSIEEQTRACIESLQEILAERGLRGVFSRRSAGAFRAGQRFPDRHPGRNRVRRLSPAGGRLNQRGAPWHCLNFFPELQGQGSLRPTTRPL